MEPRRFDTLAKTFSRRLSRRTAIGGLAIAIAAPIGRAAAQEATPTTSGECLATTGEDNLATARRWFDEAINEGALDVIDEIVSPDAVHNPAGFPDAPNPERIKEILGSVRRAFPDIHVTIEETLVDDEMVAMRWTGTGTHQDEHLGVAATGEPRAWSGIHIFRFACGLIVEVWNEVDNLARLGMSPIVATAAEATPATVATAATPAACADDSEEANAEVARQVFSVWATQDFAVYDDLLHPNILHHWGYGQDTVGIERLAERQQAFFEAFPDLEHLVLAVIVDGDLVALRYTATGTHTGQFFDLAPSGIPVTMSGVNIFRIACGQVVETWSEFSGFELRQQVEGLVPAGTPAA